jgi:protein gp37
MGKSKIEWTEKVWNPITGCTQISAGCDNCYAKRESPRFKNLPGYSKENPFKPTFHANRLDQPLRWRKPSRIFVCSMGDLFHEEIKFEQIAAVFGVIAASPQHTFQVLTKRPERMKEFFEWLVKNKKQNVLIMLEARERFNHKKIEKYFDFWRSDFGKEAWPLPNLWLGVTAENQEQADKRIPILLQTTAAKRFVSIEPMLSEIEIINGKKNRWTMPTDIDSSGNKIKWTDPGKKFIPLDWVIVGGETGSKARPMHDGWVYSIKEQCKNSGTPFFFKGWGEWVPFGQSPPGTMFNKKRKCTVSHTKTGKKIAGCLLDGVEHKEYPND